MTLIISNEEINDIMKIATSLKESGLLIKGVSNAIKNETKERKGRFLGMLLGTLSASLLGNLLTGKDTITAGEGRPGFLMPPHPLTNFEILSYYENEPKFNGVFSRNNLPKRKGGVYVINLDEFKLIGTHWISSYVNGNNIIYFDSFVIELELNTFQKKLKNS